jgi:carboxymethylenebutenolidase
MMKKLTKEDSSQEVFDLYDNYAHTKIEKRRFVEKLSLLAIGILTVPCLLSFMKPNYLDSIIIKPSDAKLKSDYITYKFPKVGGEIKVLLSQPTGAKKKLSGIIVEHKNRGLSPYIEYVGRRAAVEGCITLAPDVLSPVGGYPGNDDDDDGRELQKKTSHIEMLEDVIGAYEYLKFYDHCNGHLGLVAFCFNDWPTYEATLKKNKLKNTAFIDLLVNHSFHNNTTPRYDDVAAKESWTQTIEFFKKKLINN